jgi:hypothetical protein
MTPVPAHVMHSKTLRRLGQCSSSDVIVGYSLYKAQSRRAEVIGCENDLFPTPNSWPTSFPHDASDHRGHDERARYGEARTNLAQAIRNSAQPEKARRSRMSASLRRDGVM